MELSLSLYDGPLLDAFRAAPQVLRDHLSVAVWSGAEAIQIEARATHHFVKRSGELEAAVTALSVSDTTARVFLNTSLPYAASIHDGSVSHWIYPKNKKMLRWPTPSGGWGISIHGVHHPGTKPDQFLYAAAEAKRQDIENNINAAITTSLREAGL
jgi:hypothetical protein